MKTFFLVLIVLCTGLGVGGFAGAYYFQHEFTRVTSLNWDEFTDYHAQCETQNAEPCGIYGGFAPKSKINVER